MALTISFARSCHCERDSISGNTRGVLRFLTVGSWVADAAGAVSPDTDSDKTSEATETGRRRQVMARLKTEFAAEERPEFDGSDSLQFVARYNSSDSQH